MKKCIFRYQTILAFSTFDAWSVATEIEDNRQLIILLRDISMPSACISCKKKKNLIVDARQYKVRWDTQFVQQFVEYCAFTLHSRSYLHHHHGDNTTYLQSVPKDARKSIERTIERARSHRKSEAKAIRPWEINPFRATLFRITLHTPLDTREHGSSHQQHSLLSRSARSRNGCKMTNIPSSWVIALRWLRGTTPAKRCIIDLVQSSPEDSSYPLFSFPSRSPCTPPPTCASRVATARGESPRLDGNRRIDHRTRYIYSGSI